MTGSRDVDLRGCFVGDSFVDGLGDRSVWAGSVGCAPAPSVKVWRHGLLGVRRDTSTLVYPAWSTWVGTPPTPS